MNRDNGLDDDLSDEELEALHEEELRAEAESTNPPVDVPSYLGDIEPTGKLDKAKFWLLKGKSREELIDDGHNKGTVRIAANQLTKEGLMKKPPRLLKPGPETKSEAAIAKTTGRATQVFAKGSPPEGIIDGLTIPLVDGQTEGFEQGMKFGMSTLVLAVRIMQEMSAVSIQQVKPLIDLTRNVREGEVNAFKTGADEGAMKAAQAMGQTILPMVAGIESKVDEIAKGSGEGDPMKAMMVRTVEPLIKNLMGKLLPGAKAEPPSGWTTRKE